MAGQTTTSIKKTPPRTADKRLARPSDGPTLVEPTHAQIAECAYFRFVNRGNSDGNEVDDWLAAEAELRASLGHVDG